MTRRVVAPTESNLYLSLRRRSFYPLNYGAFVCRRVIDDWPSPTKVGSANSASIGKYEHLDLGQALTCLCRG